MRQSFKYVPILKLSEKSFLAANLVPPKHQSSDLGLMLDAESIESIATRFNIARQAFCPPFGKSTVKFFDPQTQTITANVDVTADSDYDKKI